MQLDAEDEDVPYYKPPVIPLPSKSGEDRLSGETAAESAAIIKADQED